MGTGSSRPESTSAVNTKSADEPDVASSSDWSVDGQTAVKPADHATAPAQTQQDNAPKKTETEEERMKREKKEKTKQEYLEIRVDDVWLKVDESVDCNPPSLEPETRRTGWHTVRIFVSSTFRDFHTERDILVKKASMCSYLNS